MALSIRVTLNTKPASQVLINRFVKRHWVVTLEALKPGSVLLSTGKRESLGEEECLQPRLETVIESLLRTVFGNEFQTAGAEHRKARFANGRLTQRRGDRSQVMAALLIVD